MSTSGVSGQLIIGVNGSDEVYYREGVDGTGWRKLDGVLMKQVSISSNGQHIIGCNGNDEIHYRAGVNGEWRMLDGKLKHCTVGSVTQGMADEDD